jgi:hypothetical protein
MPKHPTVDIPNVGPMDHAWDVLGAWAVEFELPVHDDAIPGKLTVVSWKEAELELDPWSAAAVGLPERILLERASRVHLTDAGGGALQWVYVATEDDWTLQATLWPGSLHLFVQNVIEPGDHLYRAVATRTREYYSRKYPLVTS